MTTEQKISFLELSQEIAAMNTKMLEAAKKIEADEDAEEILQASAKLIQAQNNILKAINK